MSHARNIGIEISTGEYICFVDSDDIIAPTYCESLLNMLIEDNSDASACSIMRFINEHMLKSVITDENSMRICLKRCDIWKNIVGKECSAEGYIANKMFRRSAIGEIRFDETLYMSEDQLFVFLVFSKINLISVCTDRLYFYRQNPNSTTGNLDLRGYEQAIFVAKSLLPIVSEDVTVVEKYNNYVAHRYYEKALCLMRTQDKTKYQRIREAREEYVKYRSGKIMRLDVGWKRYLGENLFASSDVLFMLYGYAYNLLKKIKKVIFGN